MNQLSIEYRSLDDLIPYASNAKQHEPEQIALIAASIKEFGFNNPILLDGDNGVIAGHGRLMAAQKLNLGEVPTIELQHLTQQQKKAYILADNRLAEVNTYWDFDLVSAELEALQIEGFDIELTGFDDSFILKELEEGLTDEDAVPDAPDDPVTVLGDIWLMGEHRLMCGSSTSIDQTNLLFSSGHVDLVFSDPPYGIDVVQGDQVGGGGPTKFGTDGAKNIVDSSTYMKIQGDQTTEVAKEFYQTCIAKEIKNILLWGGNYFTDFLEPSRCWVVWNKEMTGNFSQAEMAWTSFRKGGVSIFKHLWNGLSREGSRAEELKKRVHPTQKPVGLFVKIFERFNGFKTIYDGFMGSGSTLIACQKLGIQCYGMEIEPHYVDVALTRWQDYTGKQATLESTGQTFEEVKQSRAHEPADDNA